jgi:putative PIG3 family NAD(P)H quinone oxidoreductase
MEVQQGRLTGGLAPIPTLAPHEVLIKVAYAGINRADVMQVAGNYAPPEGAPAYPGLEVSGHIVAMGDQAGDFFEPGDEVCALLSGGGYAEYVAVHAKHVLMVPPSLSLAQAATLPEGLATAVMALGMTARLRPGERVLLHGGASGTGILLAQVAKVWGAGVYATVGDDTKRSLLSTLGIHGINHRVEAFDDAVRRMTSTGVDVILDTLGGPYLDRHLKLLRPGGRLVSLAMLEGGETPPMKIGGILLKNLTISSAMLRSRSAADKTAIMAAVQHTLWPHVTSGAIKPVLDEIFPLAQAEKAHARMQERLHIGKILLEVAPERGS